MTRTGRARTYALYLLAQLDTAPWWRTLAAIALIVAIFGASIAAVVVIADAAGIHLTVVAGCALMLRALLRDVPVRIGGES